MNKFQWNFDRNSNIFIQENAFESVVCEMTAILSRPQCVNKRLSYSRRRNIYEKVLLASKRHYANNPSMQAGIN